MPSYQINPLGGVLSAQSNHPVAARLCCEQCMQVLHEFDQVEPMRSRLSNLTAQGMVTLWPDLAEVIADHERLCRRMAGRGD